MRRSRFGRIALLLVAPALLASCAAGRRGPVVGDETLVTVENNLVPPTAVTVRVVSETGGRELLGNLAPGSTRTFRFRSRAVTAEHRLVAETADGDELASRPFALGPDDEVVWSLRTDVLEVRQRS